MRETQVSRLKHSAGQVALGAAGVSAITALCFPAHLDLTIPGFLYLLLVVFLSVTGGFASSAIVAVIAVACLEYFLHTADIGLEHRQSYRLGGSHNILGHQPRDHAPGFEGPPRRAFCGGAAKGYGAALSTGFAPALTGTGTGCRGAIAKAVPGNFRPPRRMPVRWEFGETSTGRRVPS